jgi:hypothetical protein
VVAVNAAFFIKILENVFVSVLIKIRGHKSGCARAPRGRRERGKRQSRPVQGKAPGTWCSCLALSPSGREEGCLYLMMAAELLKRMVEECGWKAERELGQGVVRLMWGRRMSGEI